MDIKATVIQNSWRSYKMCKVPKLIVKNISNLIDELVEQAVLCEEVGFDGLWLDMNEATIFCNSRNESCSNAEKNKSKRRHL